MERLGGDEDLAQEVIALFRQDCPRYLARIELAIEERNAEALHAAAHALKGAAGNLSADPAAAVAAELEALALSGDLTRAPEARRLHQEVTRLLSSLEAS